MIWRTYERYYTTYKPSSRLSGTVFDFDDIRTRISDLEFQMQSPDFWQDHEKAGQLSKELNGLKDELYFWDDIQAKLDLYSHYTDDELQASETEVGQLKKDFDKRYITTFLSGTYDRGNAILSVHAGAGGVDAQDWADMLLRMYQKYCEQAGFGFVLIHQTVGEQGGTKSATVEVSGRYAYGHLKGEAGVHRLVRISPFSAKALRHTSFALVDIAPIIEDVKMEIRSEDLRVDTFRSSGPGGQNVNKLETAIRITHLPTGIAVAVQSERSQAQNKEKAMQLLRSKLAERMEATKAKELSELRGHIEDSSIEWGNQIRSYVLNPYKLVKDTRTGVESSQPEAVLAGDLEAFIEAEIINLKND